MDRPFQPARKKSRTGPWSRDSRELPLIPENQLHFSRSTRQSPEGSDTNKDPDQLAQYLPELSDPYVAAHLRTASMTAHMRHRREHSTMSELYMQEPPIGPPPHREPGTNPIFEPEILQDQRPRQAVGTLGPPPTLTSRPPPEEYSDANDSVASSGSEDNTNARGPRQVPGDVAQNSIGEPGPLVARGPSEDPQWLVASKPKLSKYSTAYEYVPFSNPASGGPASGPYYYNPAAPNEYSRYDNARLMDIPGEEYNEGVVYQTWSPTDIQELKRQVELAERFKWRYISDRLSAMQNRRIPAIACQRKFKEMFGVAEADSKLKSSLFYVAYRSGWPTIRDAQTQLDLELDEPHQRSSTD